MNSSSSSINLSNDEIDKLADFIVFEFAISSMQHYRQNIFTSISVRDFVQSSTEYIYFALYLVNISFDSKSSMSKLTSAVFGIAGNTLGNVLPAQDKKELSKIMREEFGHVTLQYQKTRSVIEKISPDLDLPHLMPAYTAVGLFQKRISELSVPLIDLTVYENSMNFIKFLNSLQKQRL